MLNHIPSFLEIYPIMNLKQQQENLTATNAKAENLASPCIG
jgi:hypothetical protein